MARCFGKWDGLGHMELGLVLALAMAETHEHITLPEQILCRSASKRLGPWWPKFGLLAMRLGRLNLREPRYGEEGLAGWPSKPLKGFCELDEALATRWRFSKVLGLWFWHSEPMDLTRARRVASFSATSA
ncbi:hypothetical protein L3X38_033787 [Prunus dulcis]|uniref:Uncharacterized protein n=1 Tax=Prunus dulcis TaxID=3755 RepID=A0AAD4YX94_PRUDU|nr:hypothetical protein L3X38_033787 [Prunus dulcis]